jgi:hypothetical protein
MTMRITVYDEHGEPFEVVPSVARELIVDRGWTTTPEKNVPVFRDEPVLLVPDLAEDAPVMPEEAPVESRRLKRGRNASDT